MHSAADTEALLSKLCIELGFCLDADAIKKMLQSPPETVEEFTAQVFRFEGLDPETADRHLVRQVKNFVAAAFDIHK